MSHKNCNYRYPVSKCIFSEIVTIAHSRHCNDNIPHLCIKTRNSKRIKFNQQNDKCINWTKKGPNQKIRPLWIVKIFNQIPCVSFEAEDSRNATLLHKVVVVKIENARSEIVHSRKDKEQNEYIIYGTPMFKMRHYVPHSVGNDEVVESEEKMHFVWFFILIVVQNVIEICIRSEK